MFYVLVNGLSLTGMNNGFAQSSQENILSVMKNLRLGVHDAKTRIVMDVKGPITYRYFLLANPYRLVLDMLEVDFELNPAPRNSTGGVLGYRFGLLKPGISRVVVDLSKPFLVDKHFIIKPGAKPQSRLVIDLIPTTRSKFLAYVRKSRNQEVVGLLKLKSEEQKQQIESNAIERENQIKSLAESTETTLQDKINELTQASTTLSDELAQSRIEILL